MNTIDRIEKIVRQLNPELWVLVAEASEARGGLTATAVSPAHIDREHPTLLVSLGANHRTAELMDSAGRFVAHLLTVHQSAVGWNFANGSSRDRDKLSGHATERTPQGALRLQECYAWLECRVFARLDAGDRVYYWSDIVDASEATCGEGPLTVRHFIGQLSDQQRDELLNDQRADVQLQRPLWQAWRRDLPDELRPRDQFPPHI